MARRWGSGMWDNLNILARYGNSASRVLPLNGDVGHDACMETVSLGLLRISLLPWLCVSLARADVPRAWTWDPPAGAAAQEPCFIPLVRTLVSPTTSPEAAAEEICAIIEARGLAAGSIGLVPLNLGRDFLVGNAADRINDPAVPETIRGGTPWTLNGRAAFGAWMDRFIARYQSRQLESGIPDPDRWHLDCELRLPALRYLPDVSDCWGTAPLRLFEAMQQDPRWNSEPLLMNPGGAPTTLTIAAHYAAAGSPRFDPTVDRGHPINRGWSVWWDGMSREAVEGALNETIFQRVRDAWPDARTSEFAESMRLDAGLEPDGSRREYVDFEWWNQGWMRSHWVGRADLQAPALYLFGTSFLPPKADFWRENMRLHRSNLDACLHSFGGVAPSAVTPWVTLPRIALPAGEGQPDRAVSDEEFIELMALLRGRGIDEFMLWPGGDAGLWSAASLAIHAAWDCELTHVEIEIGSGSTVAAGEMRRADRVASTVNASSQGLSVRTTFSTPAPSASQAEGRFWIALEATSSISSAAITIEAQRVDGLWEPLADVPFEQSASNAVWLGPFEAAGLVAADGSMQVRARVAAKTGLISVDLLQLIRAPRELPTPDTNGDGAVNAEDLANLLSDWGTAQPRSDLDTDGSVGAPDLAILLSAWTG
jgi:hypothetical protein